MTQVICPKKGLRNAYTDSPTGGARGLKSYGGRSPHQSVRQQSYRRSSPRIPTGPLRVGACACQERCAITILLLWVMSRDLPLVLSISRGGLIGGTDNLWTRPLIGYGGIISEVGHQLTPAQHSLGRPSSAFVWLEFCPSMTQFILRIGTISISMVTVAMVQGKEATRENMRIDMMSARGKKRESPIETICPYDHFTLGNTHVLKNRCFRHSFSVHDAMNVGFAYKSKSSTFITSKNERHSGPGQDPYAVPNLGRSREETQLTVINCSQLSPAASRFQKPI